MTYNKHNEVMYPINGVNVPWYIHNLLMKPEHNSLLPNNTAITEASILAMYGIEVSIEEKVTRDLTASAEYSYQTRVATYISGELHLSPEGVKWNLPRK